MSILYKDPKFDAMVGVKVHKRRKKLYQKHKLNLSKIARQAWESSLKKAEREHRQGA